MVSKKMILKDDLKRTWKEDGMAYFKIVFKHTYGRATRRILNQDIRFQS
jgi:hypothetical protein